MILCYYKRVESTAGVEKFGLWFALHIRGNGGYVGQICLKCFYLVSTWNSWKTEQKALFVHFAH